MSGNKCTNVNLSLICNEWLSAVHRMRLRRLRFFLDCDFFYRNKWVVWDSMEVFTCCDCHNKTKSHRTNNLWKINRSRNRTMWIATYSFINLSKSKRLKTNFKFNLLVSPCLPGFRPRDAILSCTSSVILCVTSSVEDVGLASDTTSTELPLEMVLITSISRSRVGDFGGLVTTKAHISVLVQEDSSCATFFLKYNGNYLS